MPRAQSQAVPRRWAVERRLYEWSKKLRRLTGRLPPAVETPLRVGARRVFLVHNPKAAGSSLKRLLGVRARKTTHATPAELFRREIWQNNIFVVAVRHPLARFLSSYRYHVKSGYGGKLVKRHGDLSDLTPLQYFDFIAQYPENCGLQSRWTDYPSAAKPQCDIILRTEDSADWPAILRAHGIEPVADEAPRLNVTAAPDQAADDLGMTEAEFAELRARVESFYRSDYLRFGYDFG